MANEIILSGFKEFANKLKSLPKEIKEQGAAHVEDAALNWEERAKQAAPVDQGFLRSGIGAHKTGEMTWEVNSSSEESAWMEWGTGHHAKIPADLAAYAQQFKGKGGGTAEEAMENIKGWVKRKGIRFDSAGTFKSGAKKGQNKKLTEEQTAYIIFHFIMLHGIKPHPYFFIQKPAIEKELIANLRKLLETPR
jgi:hypothetical protein